MAGRFGRAWEATKGAASATNSFVNPWSKKRKQGRSDERAVREYKSSLEVDKLKAEKDAKDKGGFDQKIAQPGFDATATTGDLTKLNAWFADGLTRGHAREPTDAGMELLQSFSCREFYDIIEKGERTITHIPARDGAGNIVVDPDTGNVVMVQLEKPLTVSLHSPVEENKKDPKYAAAFAEKRKALAQQLAQNPGRVENVGAEELEIIYSACAGKKYFPDSNILVWEGWGGTRTLPDGTMVPVANPRDAFFNFIDTMVKNPAEVPLPGMFIGTALKDLSMKCAFDSGVDDLRRNLYGITRGIIDRDLARDYLTKNVMLVSFLNRLSMLANEAMLAPSDALCTAYNVPGLAIDPATAQARLKELINGARHDLLYARDLESFGKLKERLKMFESPALTEKAVMLLERLETEISVREEILKHVSDDTKMLSFDRKKADNAAVIGRLSAALAGEALPAPVKTALDAMLASVNLLVAEESVDAQARAKKELKAFANRMRYPLMEIVQQMLGLLERSPAAIRTGELPLYHRIIALNVFEGPRDEVKPSMLKLAWLKLLKFIQWGTKTKALAPLTFPAGVIYKLLLAPTGRMLREACTWDEKARLHWSLMMRYRGWRGTPERAEAVMLAKYVALTKVKPDGIRSWVRYRMLSRQIRKRLLPYSEAVEQARKRMHPLDIASVMALEIAENRADKLFRRFARKALERHDIARFESMTDAKKQVLREKLENAQVRAAAKGFIRKICVGGYCPIRRFRALKKAIMEGDKELMDARHGLLTARRRTLTGVLCALSIAYGSVWGAAYGYGKIYDRPEYVIWPPVSVQWEWPNFVGDWPMRGDVFTTSPRKSVFSSRNWGYNLSQPGEQKRGPAESFLPQDLANPRKYSAHSLWVMYGINNDYFTKLYSTKGWGRTPEGRAAKEKADKVVEWLQEDNLQQNIWGYVNEKGKAVSIPSTLLYLEELRQGRRITGVKLTNVKGIQTAVVSYEAIPKGLEAVTFVLRKSGVDEFVQGQMAKDRKADQLSQLRAGTQDQSVKPDGVAWRHVDEQYFNSAGIRNREHVDYLMLNPVIGNLVLGYANLGGNMYHVTKREHADAIAALALANARAALNPVLPESASQPTAQPKSASQPASQPAKVAPKDASRMQTEEGDSLMALLRANGVDAYLKTEYDANTKKPDPAKVSYFAQVGEYVTAKEDSRDIAKLLAALNEDDRKALLRAVVYAPVEAQAIKKGWLVKRETEYVQRRNYDALESAKRTYGFVSRDADAAARFMLENADARQYVLTFSRAEMPFVLRMERLERFVLDALIPHCRRGGSVSDFDPVANPRGIYVEWAKKFGYIIDNSTKMKEDTEKRTKEENATRLEELRKIETARKEALAPLEQKRKEKVAELAKVEGELASVGIKLNEARIYHLFTSAANLGEQKAILDTQKKDLVKEIAEIDAEIAKTNGEASKQQKAIEKAAASQPASGKAPASPGAPAAVSSPGVQAKIHDALVLPSGKKGKGKSMMEENAVMHVMSGVFGKDMQKMEAALSGMIGRMYLRQDERDKKDLALLGVVPDKQGGGWKIDPAKAASFRKRLRELITGGELVNYTRGAGRWAK